MTYMQRQLNEMCAIDNIRTSIIAGINDTLKGMMKPPVQVFCCPNTRLMQHIDNDERIVITVGVPLPAGTLETLPHNDIILDFHLTVGLHCQNKVYHLLRQYIEWLFNLNDADFFKEVGLLAYNTLSMEMIATVDGTYFSVSSYGQIYDDKGYVIQEVYSILKSNNHQFKYDSSDALED